MDSRVGNTHTQAESQIHTKEQTKVKSKDAPVRDRIVCIVQIIEREGKTQCAPRADKPFRNASVFTYILECLVKNNDRDDKDGVWNTIRSVTVYSCGDIVGNLEDDIHELSSIQWLF